VLAIVLGCLLTVLFIKISGEPSEAMIGALYGAVTNTPGLGAAQQTFSDIHDGVSNPMFAQGYAVAYPLGVVGIILSIVVLRSIFLKQGKDEDALFQQNAPFNGLELIRKMAERFQTHDDKRAAKDQAKIEAKKSRASRIAAQNRLNERDNKPHLFYIFIGIALGVILGMVPIYFPGIPVAVRLGLAGGPLIVSIIISYIGPDLRFPTHTTKSANLMLRETGISLFMASVGLGAGDGFIQTIVGGGYMWVIYGFLITIIPCLVVGIIGRYCFNLSIYSVAGLIAGSHTDPPALAFSNTLCPNNESSVAYTTVYPLTMFLRILAAQVLVILL
jgi:AspT/YidE/YbjL antiporter-like protein